MTTIDKSISFSVQAAAGSPTALSTLCAGLAAGQSSLALGDTGFTQANTEQGNVLNYQSRWQYDSPRRIGLFLGKEQQSQGGTAHHFRYDEATNTWSQAVPTWGTGAEQGHIYDANAYDQSAGTEYYQKFSARLLRNWTVGSPLDQWTDMVIDFSPLNGISVDTSKLISTGETAQAWHPNLFGPGDGGLVIACHAGFGGWRKSNNTCYVLADVGRPPNNETVDGPGMDYCVGLDAVICTRPNDNKTWKVAAGGAVTPIGNTPLSVGCKPGLLWARMVDDPLGRPFVWAFEVTGQRRMWTCDGVQWTAKAGQHPFTDAQYSSDGLCIVATVRSYGVIWALERYASSVRSNIWRPV